jgi:hypothetical protein
MGTGRAPTRGRQAPARVAGSASRARGLFLNRVRVGGASGELDWRNSGRFGRTSGLGTPA